MALTRSQCPMCAEAGNDTSKDNLVTYANGTKHCHACGYHDSSQYIEAKNKPQKEFRGFPNHIIPCTGIKWRGITPEMLEPLGVKEYLLLDKEDEEVGPSGVVLFPMYDRSNTLIGLKYRDFWKQYEMDRPKTECIYVEGSTTLGGTHTLKKQKQTVCIWEGEVDWIVAFKLFPEYNHLYVPGTKCTKYLQDFIMEIRRHRKIILGFDNDDAGNLATEEAVSILPKHKVSVFDFSPFDVNDLDEYITEYGYDNKKQLIDTLRPVGTDHLVTETELVESTLIYYEQRKRLTKVSTGYTVIDNMLNGGLTVGEFLVLTAEAGLGKSTLTANICYNLMQSGIKTFWAGTEMQYQQTFNTFVERHLGTQVQETEDGWSVDEVTVKEALTELSDKIVFYNSLDLEYENLHNAILSAIYRHQVRVVFIDVLNDIQGFSDWQECKQMLSGISKIVVGDVDDNRPPVTLIAVVHQKDVVGRSSYKVTYNSMAGGGELRRKPTCIIGMEGEVGEDTYRKLVLLKQSRTEGASIYEGEIYFDKTQRRYTETRKQERVRSIDNRVVEEQINPLPIRNRKDTIRKDIRTGLHNRRRAY